MNFPFKPQILALIACLCALSSCAKVSEVASRVPTPKLKMPQFKKPNLAFLNPKKFSWRDLRLGKKVPIVEVRSEDLKKQPSGEKLYLAYNKKKQQYGYYSNKGRVFTPVDFDPSKLAGGEDGIISSTGILPSLSGTDGPSTPLKIPDSLPPVDLPDIPQNLELPEDLGVPATPSPVELPPVPDLPDGKDLEKLELPDPSASDGSKTPQTTSLE